MSSERSALGQYLNEMGKISIPTREEEVKLGISIMESRKAKEELESGKEISPEEKLRLEQLVQEGKRAQEDLVTGNLRLVVSIARKYTGRGLSLEDLIQEGNMGLMVAAGKYDYRKG